MMNTRRPGSVYFLILRDPLDFARDFALVKIGITSGDVTRRISTLQTGNPYDLVLFESLQTRWPREVEHFMHRTHAKDMLKTEWIRCNLESLPELIDEARGALERIERRKDREAALAVTASNGRTRRATLPEFRMHREARDISRRLVPAKLKLQAAEALLHAATDDTSGIEGVVRVWWFQPSQRFDIRLAEAKFPAITTDCQRPAVQGSFRWRRMPKPTDFPDEYEGAISATHLAQVKVASFLSTGTPLQARIARTQEIENWHDDYLQLLPVVKRLEGDLADIRTELAYGLGEFDAMDPVCSFVRRSTAQLDTLKFRTEFPEQFLQCVTPVDAQLRKLIYPNRSYLPLEP